MKAQPWMHSARFDLIWILLPPFFAVALVAGFQILDPERMNAAMSPLAWLVTVVGLDVAHVYATIYRAGMKPRLLIYVPLLGFALSCLLYRWDALIFWRSLAYLAIFHFVRQPYGIMRFYQKGETSTGVDKLAIYGASLYPLLVWHLGPERDFGWFMSGDIHAWNVAWLLPYVHALAVGLALAYGMQEWRRRELNIPKNLVIIGTAVAWGLGIVAWNNDRAFTLTNIISHGVPYMAMIWIHNGARFWRPDPRTDWRWVAPLLFCVTLFVLAYAEEGLWDAWVWHDHPEIFPWFSAVIQPVADSALVWIVPLLALPQLTHYVLDGFIWRLRRSGS